MSLKGTIFRLATWTRLALALVLLVALVPSHSKLAHAAEGYTITDLGPLPGDTSVELWGMNNLGQVVGSSSGRSGGSRAVMWQAGTVTALGGPGTIARAINDAGTVVGEAFSDGTSRAVRWEGGRMTVLSVPPGYAGGQALSINAVGHIAGAARPPRPTPLDNGHAVVWADGAVTDLGTLPGGMTSYATDINDRGDIVGLSAINTSQPGHAFIWRGGRMEDLGILPGDAASPGDTTSGANAINNAGQVVGESGPFQGTPFRGRAFIWQGGTMADLGILPGLRYSYAEGINDGGQAVGYSIGDLGGGVRDRAFLHTGGALTDLNTLLPNNSGWTLERARAINDLGQIAGIGTRNGQKRAFLLTPRAAQERCFPETGRCIAGRFLAHWSTNGGLPLYGYPLTSERRERLEDGREYTVQYFERARFELHPENSQPYDVLLGQFGRVIHPAAPPVPPTSGAQYFPETGHNVARQRFIDYWQANGGLAQFGYPISEELDETLEDGKAYRVQYFERARFEWHPENAAPHDVLLGQFGRRILSGR